MNSNKSFQSPRRLPFLHSFAPCSILVVKDSICQFAAMGSGGGGGGGQLISVYPEELTFGLESQKQSTCSIKVVNNTQHHVAFKVKTTSPKKYAVRPNTSVVQPWDSCTITVTLQAQKEYPIDMQCKDKFLLQSRKVPPVADIDELPPDTFNKDDNKVIEEMKLSVTYMAPRQSGRGNSDDESDLTSAASRRGSTDMMNSFTEENQTIQRLREERDATIQHTNHLKRELEFLKRRRNHKRNGFSLTFTAFAALIGLMAGFLLNLTLSTPPST